MKIVYPLLDSYANELIYSIAKEAIRRGMEFEIATESKVVEDYMTKKGIPVFNSKKYRERILNEEKCDFTKEFDLIENKYKATEKDLTFSDAILSKKPAEYRKKILTGYIKTWEHFFEKSKPDIVIGTDGSESFGITYATVAKNLGLNVIFTNGSTLFPDSMIWDSRIWLVDWVDRRYFERELTDVEREKVMEYVTRIQEKKPMIGIVPKNPISIDRIKRALKYWYTCIIKEGGGMAYHNPIASLKFAGMPVIREKFNKKFYSEPDYNQKYIFFPMHVPYDSMMTLRTPQFLEQYKPIQMCAKHIPHGYTLYVKEHPHAKGSIPLEWLKKIIAIPNVKLVPPDVSSHELIMNAKCIITINSDVGWEALMHGKPSVVLAKPFYSGFGVTFDVDCFKYSDVSKVEYDETCEKRLPAKIEEALKEKIDPERVNKLVNATMNSVYPCSFFKSDVYCEYNVAEDNIRKIVDSILDYYKKNLNNNEIH